jgi:hypothetical protein
MWQLVSDLGILKNNSYFYVNTAYRTSTGHPSPSTKRVGPAVVVAARCVVEVAAVTEAAAAV